MDVIPSVDAHDAQTLVCQTVKKELDRQRKQNVGFADRIKRDREGLESVLREVGKVSLDDRKRGFDNTDILTESSIAVFPIVSDGSEIQSREQLQNNNEMMGLISNNHPEFLKCKSYACPFPDATSKSTTKKLQRQLITVSERLDNLENENCLRRLEICVLRRIINEIGFDKLTDSHKAVLDTLALGRTPFQPEEEPRPIDESYTTGNSANGIEIERKAIGTLSEESLEGLLKAVYQEPTMLRGLRNKPLI